LLWLAAKRWAGKAPWITFLAGTRAMVLAFLRGADLGLNVFPVKWKESTAVGLVGFFSSTVVLWCVSRRRAGFGRCSCRFQQE